MQRSNDFEGSETVYDLVQSKAVARQSMVKINSEATEQ